MFECTDGNFIGEKLIAEVCLDWDRETDYEDLDYIPLGQTNSKQLTTTINKVEIITDTSGATAGNIVTGLTAEITISGFKTDIDTLTVNQNEFIEWATNKANAGECVNGVVRFLYPARAGYSPAAHYIHVSFNTTGNIGGGSKDAVTFEVTATATSTFLPDFPAVVFIKPQELPAGS